ncbi:MAG: dihydroorotate dehydrogenase [Erysipelotrichales bacterium]|nr:dihydroorotate dehydrogenase [Erysipelotrichales bacterium]
MGRLTTELSGVVLQNPIIPASGTFGFGYEFQQFYDIDRLGSISIKGTTKDARFGNPTPRIADCDTGLLNAVGLQNPGVEKVINEEIPKLREVFKQPIIANISGFSVEDYVYTAEKMDKCEDVAILELDISCPNVHGGGMSFGTDKDVVREVVSKVKAVTTKPLYVKLTPNVTNIVEIAKVCEEAGADGLSMINTLMGMRFDLKTAKPILANTTGGYSGPGIKPVALRCIYQVAKAVNLPIIGMGGVMDAYDVVEMLYAGASAVQIGAANLVDPCACIKIIEDIPRVLDELGIKDIKECIRKGVK